MLTPSGVRTIAALMFLLVAPGAAHAGAACGNADRRAVEQLLIVKVPEATGAARTEFIDWLAGRNIGGVFLSKRSTRSLSRMSQTHSRSSPTQHV